MTTRIVISSSHHRDYAFSLPIIGLLWRELVGFEPLFLLTRDEAFWRSQEKRCSVTLDALAEHKFQTVFVGSLDGYEDGRLGQNAREHAACLDLPGDDWLMMSDADLWPLSAGFYHEHEKMIEHGVTPMALCLYSNGDNFVSKEDVLARFEKGERFQTLPTCHIAMRVETWRVLYGLRVGEPIAEATKRTMDAWFARLRSRNRGFELWMCDQDIVTEKLCRQEWFPRAVRLVQRVGHPPEDRIDRCAWPIWISTAGITDAHIPKAPDQEPYWHGLFEIVRQVLPSRHAWAMNYRSRFVAGY